MTGIKLKILLPDAVFREATVDKVQIPLENGNLTLLSGRAPGIFMLGIGMIKILDEQNHEKEKFFVKSGVADFAEGNCEIMVEHIVEFDSLTISEVKEILQKTTDEKEKAFYEFIETALWMEKR